ncbi:hypothetical protein [Haloferula sp. BvORR071]|uniref:hypothetical protein n=1 Tax=Haloferula sp. BvORR071 TaxID=1396141 RepID=UPI00055626CC|nr:hypothetical protein [Haloferula sp. BvORR071]
MGPVFFIYLIGTILLWLGWIRPYCIRNRQGFTPGANVGVTMWVDWEQAGEIAKAKGDHGMLWACRAFLALHVMVAVGFVVTMLGA